MKFGERFKAKEIFILKNLRKTWCRKLNNSTPKKGTLEKDIVLKKRRERLRG